MKTKRIDDYICINIDQIITDELEEILNADIDDFWHEEDKKNWKKLQAAARVVLKYYRVP